VRGAEVVMRDPLTPLDGEESRTEAIGVDFTVKEGVRGEPWILIEMNPPGLPAIDASSAVFGLHFRSDVSFREGRAFVDEMKRMLNAMSITTPLP
jgi:hypothetical protein